MSRGRESAPNITTAEIGLANNVCSARGLYAHDKILRRRVPSVWHQGIESKGRCHRVHTGRESLTVTPKIRIQPEAGHDATRRVGKPQRAHALIQSFPKLAFVQNPSRPVVRQQAIGDIPVKAGMGPITKRRYQSVLERFGVDVIYVAFHIGIIRYQVFPVSALPNALLASGYLARTARFRRLKISGKAGLDQTPAQRIIRIAFGQAPDGMQVIRQDADRQSLEGVFALHPTVCRPQSIDMFHQG
jgi:hypothetical protein